MKLLIIDHDPDLLQWMGIFAEQNGWQLERATSGEQALVLRRRYHPDLILLDKSICAATGFKLFHELRNDQDIPIILLMNKQDSLGLPKITLTGTCDFLFKPLQAQELKLRIFKMLEGFQKLDQVLEYGPIKIDQRIKKVIVAGHRIALSPKEYEIIQLLVEEKGRIVTSQEILDRIWLGSARASAADVQQYIYLLRNKLKKSIGPHDCIHNDKGFGYRLFCPDCQNPCSRAACVTLQQPQTSVIAISRA